MLLWTCDKVNRKTGIFFCTQVETRPLTLVEATAEDGSTFSTLLQNAETVRLVGPCDSGSSEVGTICTANVCIRHPTVGAGCTQADIACFSMGCRMLPTVAGASCCAASPHGAGSRLAASHASAHASTSVLQLAQGARAPCELEAATRLCERLSSRSRQNCTCPQGWQATSVSQLAEGGSRVYILRQGAARHTGIAIQESIEER